MASCSGNIALVLRVAGSIFYVDKVAGNDANSGLSVSDPFETIQHGLNILNGGETLYVKASATYTETAFTVNFDNNVRTYLIGFSDTPGDEGLVTIDGENVRDCITGSGWNKVGYYVANFRVTRAVSHGIDYDEANDIVIINCQADNNGGRGIDVDDLSMTLGCYCFDNVSDGIKIQAGGVAHGCICNNNGDYGIIAEAGECVSCICVGNADGGVKVGYKNTTSVVNCTIDGNNLPNTRGIYITVPDRSFRFVNNIIMNCTSGIYALSVPTTEFRLIGAHNLFHNNDTDYFNFTGSMSETIGEINGDPQLVGTPSGNVTPGPLSPAIGASLGPKTYWYQGVLTGADKDIGAVQSQSPETASFEVAICPLFLYGPQASGASGVTYIDRTIHEFTYYPDSSCAVIGELDSGQTVNIQLWTSGVPVSITSSGCGEVDSTGKYIWLLDNLPTPIYSTTQYQWQMSDGSGTVVNGDFVLHTVEGDDYGMPSLGDKDSYLL